MKSHSKEAIDTQYYDYVVFGTPFLPLLCILCSICRGNNKISNQTEFSQVSMSHNAMEMIMDPAERPWEFDNVDILGDDVLMEGIEETHHSHADKISLGSKSSCRSDEFNESSPIGDNVSVDNLLLMQEPIVEDPRHEYCELISLNEAQDYVVMTKEPLVHRHLQRHVSWTDLGQVSPHHATSNGCLTTSPNTLLQTLDQFASSLRQSEMTRSYLRQQMQVTFGKGNDPGCKMRIHHRPSGRAFFSVDETRRSLISFVEEHKHSGQRDSERPSIRRCKSSDAT